MEEEAAVGVGVGSHAALGRRGRVAASSGLRRSGLIEEFFGAVAFEPLLQVALDVRDFWRGRRAGLGGSGRCLRRVGRRRLWGRSSLWDFGGRSWASWGVAAVLPEARASCWIFLIWAIASVERGGHVLVHGGGVVAFDEIRSPAVADHEAFEFFAGDAGEDGGVGDLVAVEMEDGEDGAIGDGVEEFVGVPCGGERAGLGFAIADDAGDDEVGIVESGTEGVAEGVSEFAAFVDGAGGFGATWLGIPPGKENCLKSFLRPASSWVMLG